MLIFDIKLLRRSKEKCFDDGDEISQIYLMFRTMISEWDATSDANFSCSNNCNKNFVNSVFCFNSGFPAVIVIITGAVAREQYAHDDFVAGFA